jgi:exopolysaccharide biosynthesis polyprenyl glycosylphosphotransferase
MALRQCSAGQQTSSWREVVINKDRLPIGLFKLLDLVLVVLSFGLTTALMVYERRGVSFSQFLSMRTRIANLVIFCLFLLICHLTFSFCGLYLSRRLSSRRAEITDVFNADTLAVGCFAAFSWLLSIRMVTAPFLVVFWISNMTVLCASRFVLRFILASIRVHGRNLRHMLVLGTNPRAVNFARKLLADRERGYRILGFVDDDWPGMAEFRESGFQVVSDYVGLKTFLRLNVVDEVTIYLPFGSLYSHCHDVADLCQQHGIIMRFNSDIFGLNAPNRRTEEFDGDHFVATLTGMREGWPVMLKRTLDIVVSATLLLLLSPLFALAAFAIKIGSKGPVFFIQERVGLNKRIFRIYKFRTMIPNAEKLIANLERQNEATGPVFKIQKDPRITPIGKVLRKSSIDELPQLLNVLKGDMSLVGPRPLPIRDYEGFSEDWQRRRFSVKPGITCLWQVNGRSGISFDQWMQLDLQYLDEWSLWLDFKILAKTVPAVLRGSGAA